MNLIVHQSIVIQQLKVGGITNSSILQIGTAGIIKSQANLFNTGQYTGPAPPALGTAAGTAGPLVPLASPR
ncbi:spore germination protein GerPB [Paenibacillus sp. HJGM_3]|uniref:spore germination protein GerPB n=1 Tax=Paenibacillus sp. HJGM_3 TaxID=3379816 RepID=UPI003859D880